MPTNNAALSIVPAVPTVPAKTKPGRKIQTRTLHSTGNVTVISSGTFNGTKLISSMSLGAVDADGKPYSVSFGSSAEMRAVAEAILAAL